MPNAKFVGGNLLRGPVRDLESPSACCDRCLNYRGRERCVAYTFYWNNGRSECWLKRTSAILQVSPFGQAGFPNFFLNETYPDLSSDLGEQLHLIYNLKFELCRAFVFWHVGFVYNAIAFVVGDGEGIMGVYGDVAGTSAFAISI